MGGGGALGLREAREREMKGGREKDELPFRRGAWPFGSQEPRVFWRFGPDLGWLVLEGKVPSRRVVRRKPSDGDVDGSDNEFRARTI